jgi:hypothetical protein
MLGIKDIENHNSFAEELEHNKEGGYHNADNVSIEIGDDEVCLLPWMYP